MKKTEISDLKKRLHEYESKCRQLQNVFEIAKSEKSSIGKSLMEAQDEIRQLKQKFKIANKQIEQFKEEIVMKETTIANGEFCK